MRSLYLAARVGFRPEVHVDKVRLHRNARVREGHRLHAHLPSARAFLQLLAEKGQGLSHDDGHVPENPRCKLQSWESLPQSARYVYSIFLGAHREAPSSNPAHAISYDQRSHKFKDPEGSRLHGPPTAPADAWVGLAYSCREHAPPKRHARPGSILRVLHLGNMLWREAFNADRRSALQIALQKNEADGNSLTRVREFPAAFLVQEVVNPEL